MWKVVILGVYVLFARTLIAPEFEVALNWTGMPPFEVSLREDASWLRIAWKCSILTLSGGTLVTFWVRDMLKHTDVNMRRLRHWFNRPL